MAHQANFSAENMENAGFNRLFTALLALVEPALAYKVRKPAEVYLHHLQEHLLNPLTHEFATKILQFRQMVLAQIATLEENKAHIVSQVWRAIIPTLPALFDNYRPLHTTHALLGDIAKHTHQSLQIQMNQDLPNAQISLEPWATLPLLSSVVYQASEDSPEQQLINEEQLYKNISDSLTQALQQTMDSVIKDYREQLQLLLAECDTLQRGIYQAQDKLGQLASELRS